MIYIARLSTDISVEELKSLKPVEEPLWDEEERLREEYIKIHGERVYDDEDDEWDYTSKAIIPKKFHLIT